MKLEDVPARCFQGVIPSGIATCAPDGTPNVTYLSQVFAVDGTRVALSCQFFNKTKQNALSTGRATVEVYDPLTYEAYRISLRFDHEETEGPLFDRMRVRIDAIASHVGMTGVFKLRSSDVYEVLEVRRVEGFLHPAALAAPPEVEPFRGGELGALQAVSQRVCRARDLDELFTCALDALAEVFGCEHGMIFLLDETGTRLFAIATRGYGEAGVGAEVNVGDGLIGAVARDRSVLRVTGVGAELRYGRAVRTSAQRAGGPRAVKPEIPLPGLVDAQSQIALPLVAGDRLVGVIAVESARAAAFESWHEAFLEIVAAQIAVAIEHASRQDRESPASPEGRRETPTHATGAAPLAPTAAHTRRFKLFAADDCVFVDDEYLVRNLPGRILWRLLETHLATGRTEFSNRELRLDASLGLPPVRDNLESRLVLLRKRLAARDVGVRMEPTSRGHFRLDVTVPLELEVEPGAG